MSEIWGIILAAGESKRMGKQKLLLPFGEKTILGSTIDNAIHSDIKNILVVLGSHSSEIFDLIKYLPVRFCFNENYRTGMLSSVQNGIRALPPECEAVMVFPGDQPMIPPEVIKKVIEIYQSIKKGIVIPTFKKKRGHPILIDRKYFEEIIKLEQGLRTLSALHPEDVLEVECDSSGILKDIDTKEEYKELLHRVTQRKKEFHRDSV
jgi:molybdenum cofactor cytidylyltransferase